MSIRPELRDELLSLSADDRRELADQLYESLVDQEWEGAWSGELEQRMSDVTEGRVELIDAEAVHNELTAELRDLRR